MSSIKRSMGDEPMYPPKKRALYKHKLEQIYRENKENEDVMQDENNGRSAEFSYLRESLTIGHEGALLSNHALLDMKYKMESHLLQKEFTRSRSDSLHSLPSQHSDQSDSISTMSREPSPYTVSGLHDMRTPERNPLSALSNLSSNISKPLFPCSDNESSHSEGHSPEVIAHSNQVTGVSGMKEGTTSHHSFVSQNQMNIPQGFSFDLQRHDNLNKENSLDYTKLSLLKVNENREVIIKRLPEKQTLLSQNTVMRQSHENDQSKINKPADVSQSEKTMYDKVVKSAGPMMSLLEKFNAEAPKVLTPVSQFQKGSVAPDKFRPASDAPQPITIKTLDCSECGLKFSHKSELTSHMKKSHDGQRGKCRVCLVDFDTAEKLSLHMKAEHSGVNPYKCDHCDREFGQYNNLRRHMRVHREKIFKCSLCDREFNEEFYLTMHMGTHTGKRMYSCGVCNACFPSNHDLKLHVKTHSPSQLHTCDICNKSFSKACVLRQHKKGHTGERPHKCEKCPKTFIHRHHLTMHMRSHTESKPYTCDVCCKEFYQSSHLYKHMRSHEEGATNVDTSTTGEKISSDLATVNTIDGMRYHKMHHDMVAANGASGETFSSSPGDGVVNNSEMKEENGGRLSSTHPERYRNSVNMTASVEQSDKFEGDRISRTFNEIERSGYMKVHNLLSDSVVRGQTHVVTSKDQLSNVDSFKHSGKVLGSKVMDASRLVTENSGKHGCVAGAVENKGPKIENRQTTDRKNHDHTNRTKDNDASFGKSRKKQLSGPGQEHVANFQPSYSWSQKTSDQEKFSTSQPVKGYPPAAYPGTFGHTDYGGMEPKFLHQYNVGAYYPHAHPHAHPHPGATHDQSMSHPMYTAYSPQVQAYFNHMYLMNQNLLARSATFPHGNPYFPSNGLLPSNQGHGEVMPQNFGLPRNMTQVEKVFSHGSMENSQGLQGFDRSGSYAEHGFPYDRTTHREKPAKPSKRKENGSRINRQVEKQARKERVNSWNCVKSEVLDEPSQKAVSLVVGEHKVEVAKPEVDARTEVAQELVKLSTGKIGAEMFNCESRMNRKVEIGKEVLKLSKQEISDPTLYCGNRMNRKVETGQEVVKTEQTFAMDLSTSPEVNIRSVAISKEVVDNVMYDRKKDDADEENNEKVVVGYDDSLEEHKLEIDMEDEEVVEKQTVGQQGSGFSVEVIMSVTENDDAVKTEVAAEMNGRGDGDKTVVVDSEVGEIESRVVKVDGADVGDDSSEDKEICLDEVQLEKHLEKHLEALGAPEVVVEKKVTVLGERNTENSTGYVTEENNKAKLKHGSKKGTHETKSRVSKFERGMKRVESCPERKKAEDVVEETNFFCCVCFENFASAEIMEEHQLSHVQTQSVKHRCPVCGLKFTQSFDLQCHMMMKHQGEKGTKSSSRDNVTSENQSVNKENESVNSEHQSADRESYSVNKGNQSVNRLNQSMYKENQSVNKENESVNSEHQSVDKENYSVNKGNQSVNRLNQSVKTENQSDSENRNVLSEISFGVNCGPVSQNTKYHNGQSDVHRSHEQLTRSPKLDRVRQNRQKFDCKVCGEYFEKVSQLKVHMKIHAGDRSDRLDHRGDGDRPHRCDVCGRDFAHQHNLNRHKMSHNSRTFACSFCSRTFKENFYLQMHLKIHEEESSKRCEICGENVPKSELLNHTNTHLAGISKNPTYVQIGNRVKEILRQGCPNNELGVEIESDEKSSGTDGTKKGRSLEDFSQRPENMVRRSPLMSQKLALRQIQNVGYINNM